MLFLDTSVVVSLYVQEAKSAKAQRFVASQGVPAICPLVEVEFYSAIARLNRMKILSQADARQVLAVFDGHVAQGYFSFYPINQNVYDQARQWLGDMKTPLRSLDALQLAVAAVHEIVFATADRDLAKAAKTSGVCCKSI